MSGYFATMRKLHPVQVGETIDGKRVVMTCWRWSKETGDLPVYRLAGESEDRMITADTTLEIDPTPPDGKFEEYREAYRKALSKMRPSNFEALYLGKFPTKEASDDEADTK